MRSLRSLCLAATAFTALACPDVLWAKVSATADGRVMRLDGGGVTYAMGVDEQGYLQPLYWGCLLYTSPSPRDS